MPITISNAACPLKRLIGILCMLLFLETGIASETPVDFASAWLQVQQINNGLAAEQANVERTDLLAEAAKSLYLPRVDVVGAYTRLDDPVQLNALDLNPLAAVRDTPLGSTIIESFGGDAAFTTDLTERSFGTAALVARWPVFTGGRITAAQDISAAQNRVARQQLDARQRVVFEELVLAYFGVVFADEVLATRLMAEAGLAQHLDNARRLEAEGQIARVERLTVEAAHDRASVASERARQELDIAQVALQQLLHQREVVAPSDDLFINSALPPSEQIVNTVLDNSPVLKTLQAQDDEASAFLDVQRGRFQPEVYLFADYALYKDDSIAFELVPDWQVGVGIDITLVDRADRGKTISAAQKSRDSLARLSSEAERELTVVTKVLYKEAELALNEYQGLTSSLELAKENLRLRIEAFSQGFSTSVDVVDAQLFVAAVETEMSAAAFQYVTTLGKLLALSGETYRFADYQRQGRQVRLRNQVVGVGPMPNSDQAGQSE